MAQEPKIRQLSRTVFDLYFQKSRMFLLPLLSIDNKNFIPPRNTYIAWEGSYTINDKRLLCEYELIDAREFYNFEKKFLLSNDFLEDVKECENNKIVYVFNLQKFSKDWNYFLEGKYSQFSEENKKKIIASCTDEPTKEYMTSYIYPGDFFEQYAELLNTSVQSLKEIGELCNKYNLERETYKNKALNL